MRKMNKVVAIAILAAVTTLSASPAKAGILATDNAEAGILATDESDLILADVIQAVFGYILGS